MADSKMDKVVEKDRRELYDAIVSGSTETVRHLVEHRKVSINLRAEDLKVKTPLMCAVVSHNVETVRLFLEKGANVLVSNVDGMTAVHWAAKNGHCDILGMLLEACPQAINAMDKTNRTPLHFACFEGKVECVKLLVSCSGCDLSAEDEHGYLPLSYACRSDAVTGKEDARRRIEELLSSGETLSKPIQHLSLDSSGQGNMDDHNRSKKLFKCKSQISETELKGIQHENEGDQRSDDGHVTGVTHQDHVTGSHCHVVGATHHGHVTISSTLDSQTGVYEKLTVPIQHISHDNPGNIDPLPTNLDSDQSQHSESAHCSAQPARNRKVGIVLPSVPPSHNTEPESPSGTTPRSPYAHSVDLGKTRGHNLSLPSQGSPALIDKSAKERRSSFAAIRHKPLLGSTVEETGDVEGSADHETYSKVL